MAEEGKAHQFIPAAPTENSIWAMAVARNS